jgi:hypothetical protein
VNGTHARTKTAVCAVAPRPRTRVAPLDRPLDRPAGARRNSCKVKRHTLIIARWRGRHERRAVHPTNTAIVQRCGRQEAREPARPDSPESRVVPRDVTPPVASSPLPLPARGLEIPAPARSRAASPLVAARPSTTAHAKDDSSSAAELRCAVPPARRAAGCRATLYRMRNFFFCRNIQFRCATRDRGAHAGPPRGTCCG